MGPRQLVLRVLLVLGVAVSAVVAGSGALTTAPAGAAPVRAAVTQTDPVYSYANAIRQTVYVQAPFDTDGDGTPDRIAVDIVRPSEAAAQNASVPVIMDASPYYQCCGRGNESEKKAYGSDGSPTKLPLFYDNYFVPRGYAVAEVDLAGTSRSTGCGDVGGQNEVLGVKAVIDWLNGRASAVGPTGAPVTASWTNGKVGMIGKSWDGSIANGVAATGVAGLRTIVPISSISSWYDYARFNGVVRTTGYVKYLAGLVNGRPSGTCDSSIAANQSASSDSTGNTNSFWDERNYRTSASAVKASVFVVHGLNDTNVTTTQFGSWWQQLAANNVPRKIWLSQDGHVDPFDFRRQTWVDTLHRWFDYWLMGIDNGVMTDPQADVQRADGTWITQSQWPAAGTATTSVALSTLGGTATRTVTDSPNLTEKSAVANPDSTVAGRTVFATAALTRALPIAGAASVTLRVKVTKSDTELTAKLVDYGSQKRVDYQSAGSGISTLTTQSCWGDAISTDDGCYYDTSQDYVTSSTDVLTRGWQDAAHYQSLSRQTPLTAGTWYTITVPINPTDAVVAAGHRFAVVLTLSDKENTVPSTTGATVTIDPGASTLNLPVTGSYSFSAARPAARAGTRTVAPQQQRALGRPAPQLP